MRICMWLSSNEVEMMKSFPSKTYLKKMDREESDDIDFRSQEMKEHVSQFFTKSLTNYSFSWVSSKPSWSYREKLFKLQFRFKNDFDILQYHTQYFKYNLFFHTRARANASTRIPLKSTIILRAIACCWFTVSLERLLYIVKTEISHFVVRWLPVSTHWNKRDIFSPASFIVNKFQD